jgi:hypothetical protein
MRKKIQLNTQLLKKLHKKKQKSRIQKAMRKTAKADFQEYKTLELFT